MLHSPRVCSTHSDYFGSQVSLLFSPLSFSIPGNGTLSLTNLCHPEERTDERQIYHHKKTNTIGNATRPRGDKTVSMLNSAEHEIYPAHNVKMPIIVGILTFISLMNTSEKLNPKSSLFDGTLVFMSC